MKRIYHGNINKKEYDWVKSIETMKADMISRGWIKQEITANGFLWGGDGILEFNSSAVNILKTTELCIFKW